MSDKEITVSCGSMDLSLPGIIIQTCREYLIAYFVYKVVWFWKIGVLPAMRRLGWF